MSHPHDYSGRRRRPSRLAPGFPGEQSSNHMSDLTSTQRQVLALCSLTSASDRCDWGVLARQAYRDRSLDGLLAGEMHEDSARAHTTGWVLKTATPESWTAAWDRADSEYRAATAVGARLATVLDDDFPLNLRLIHNLPPFLFYRGNLDADCDAQSVAVVGTRSATPDGVWQTRRVVRSLTRRGITVTSGLAVGIDAAAHRETLACGGRTIAVLPSGITRLAPAANRDLGEAIVASGGLVVSQFFPTSTPARWTFGKRNEVTSGISQGTVVIEASSTSGARMQARLAYEHGKRVFLLDTLVAQQPWAQQMVERRRAVTVSCIEEITSRVASPDRVRDVSDLLHVEPALL